MHKVRRLIGLAVFSVFFVFMLTGRAEAIVINSGSLPSVHQYHNDGDYNACRNGPGQPVFKNAQRQWISREGNPSGISPISISSGVSSVHLQLNLLGHHCRDNMSPTPPLAPLTSANSGNSAIIDTSLTATAVNAASASASIGSISGFSGQANLDFLSTIWPPNSGTNAQYYANLASIPFTLNGLGDLSPGTHTITVTTTTRQVNWFEGKRWVCVSPAPPPERAASDGKGVNCDNVTSHARVSITISSPSTTTCTPSNSTVNTNTSQTFRVNGSSTGTAFWTASGANPSSGSGNSFTASWSSPGNKQVKVTRGGVAGTCNVNVSSPQVNTTCTPSNSNIYTGDTQTFNVGGSSTGAARWSTSTYLSGEADPISGDGDKFTTSWKSEGVKQVQVTRGGATGTCSVIVSKPPVTCTISTIPSGPFGVGQRFTVRITVNNPSGSSDVLDGSKRPLSYPDLDASIGWRAKPIIIKSDRRPTNYGIVQPGESGFVDINNVYAEVSGSHTIQARISSPRTDCDLSITTGTKPYLKAFGGEVMTGGSFAYNNGGSCTPPPGRGGIYAWSATDSSGQHIGSSAQLTVSSLLTVNQFYSASQRTSATNSLPPKGLTFANIASTSGDSTYGGGSGNALCITDYFNETRDPSLEADYSEWTKSGARGRFQSEVSPTSADLGCLNLVTADPDGNMLPWQEWTSGDCTNTYTIRYNSLGSLAIPPGVQVALYADGDVTITGDIIYNTSGVTSWDDHPYFALIVRGNIHIASNVTRLDGLYVAQPNESGDKGTIYTCARPSFGYIVGTSYLRNEIFNNCQNQLTINGGLVAHDVRFLRFHGNLSGATHNESPNSTNAAEVINYTPEMYLAPSPLKQPNSSSTETNNPRPMGAYDSIRSLPPIY